LPLSRPNYSAFGEHGLSREVRSRIEKLIAHGPTDLFAGGRKGIEKESLRVRTDGHLSESPHPLALGSAMTNQFITTDFSEALLEFVTPAYASTWETLRVLCEIHQFSYDRMQNELLWVASMPCVVGDDNDIPLAQYGSSNVGKMKTVYRNGLGHRYGRRMQTIAGVHFNYSLPDAFWPHFHAIENSQLAADDFRSESYMGLVRNFHRMGWLILYLFGASPALCKSFIAGSETDLQEFNESTLYEPFGTSLRMSDLGYSNSTQAGLNISVNSVDAYIDDLSCAICTPEEAYQKIGVKVDGAYRQLSANQLQIENEYYSAVRPKRVARSGERPTAALRRGGVEYVEIRSLDINPFDPVGINQNAMRFVEAFLIYCLLHDSPPLDEKAAMEASRNHSLTAKHGRDPELHLHRDGKKVGFTDWAREIVGDVRSIAELIDAGEGGGSYTEAVNTQAQLIEDPDATPSARVLEELRETGAGFYHFAMERALGHKDYFLDLEPLSGDRLAIYADEAKSSIERQQSIEAADEISFDEYLEQYFSEDGCR
jgi:glutamate--cysteine ligase